MKIIFPIAIFSTFTFVLATDGSRKLALDAVPMTDIRVSSQRRRLSDVFDHTAASQLEEFRKNNQLKKDADPMVEEVEKGGRIIVGDESFSLDEDDLEPVNVFVDGAVVVIDGVPEDSPTPAVFKSKKNPHFTVNFDEEGELLSGTVFDEDTGDSTSIERIQEGSHSFAVIRSDEVDDDELSQFQIDEKQAENRKLRGGLIGEDAAFAAFSSSDTDGRQLQSVGRCSSYGYDIVEVSVVVDSTFCSTTSSVQSNVQSLIARASEFYEVDGLCKKLRIKNLRINCNAATDPIRPILQSVVARRDICTTQNSLLNQFIGYTQRQNIGSDINMLVHGANLGTNTIGCAYLGALCSRFGTASGTGVNFVKFSSNSASQAKLVAHEAGHILGAGHISDTSQIMNPSVCGSCASFGRSANSINQLVARASSCISRESANDGGDADTPTVEVDSGDNEPSACQDSSTFQGSFGIQCSNLRNYSRRTRRFVCWRLSGFGTSCPVSCGTCPSR